MQVTPIAQVLLIILSALGVELSPELKAVVTDNLGIALAGFAAALAALAKLIQVWQAAKKPKEG